MARSSAANALICTGLALGTTALLAGCALPGQMVAGSAPVDASSPVAQDVIRASRHPGPYPKFSDIPAVPTDVRPASEWRTAVLDMQRRQAQLDTQVAGLPPPSNDTEAYQADALRRMGTAPSEAPPADARERTEAEARALRERATPPPPPK